jgi:predicted RecB family nuclease
MQILDGRLHFSPSDLNGFLACEHLTRLDIAVVRGALEKPVFVNPEAELIKRKGDEHEASFLLALRERGLRVEEIPFDFDWAGAAQATADAIRSGVDVVYQACFVHDGWRGFSDFLVRQPDGTYEAVDTKLARHTKPYHVLQLCFYTEQIGRLQGIEPKRMHIALGSGESESFRVPEFAAYYRRVRHRFLEAVAAEAPTDPYPVEHCGLCDFRPLCETHWDAVNPLARVAGIRRDQINRLEPVGITTLAELATAEPSAVVPRIRSATFEKLRDQAALQYARRESGRLLYHLLPPEAERGLGLLPVPSAGDLFLDLEGDPFWQADRKLEYLFGLLWQEGDEIAYRAFWAHDPDAERRAVEAVIDFIHERLTQDPQLHVLHYASYEPSTFKRLAAQYGTREEAVDDLLRREIFVDLLTVVRQGLRAGLPSYSLKQMEDFLPLVRSARIKGGDDATVAYESWRDTGDDDYLAGIEAYNREDCLATLELRDWLVSLRDEAGVTEWREPPVPRVPSEEGLEAIEEREQLKRDLLEHAQEGDERWLAAQLLDYHRREAKPAWWAYFARLEMTAAELVEDSDSIAEIEHVGAEPLPPPKRSVVHSFSFPAQEYKLASGDEVVDPVTGLSAGVIRSIDDEHGRLELVRGPGLVDVPPPKALIPGGPWDDAIQRKALLRVARSIVDDNGLYQPLRGILRGDLPRIRRRGAEIQTTNLEELKQLLTDLDDSHLFIQGPPGSGKTWTGARLIAHLLEAGKRIGVASTSHKAIHNFLDEVEVAVKENGIHFWGLKKSSAGNEESIYKSRHIQSAEGIASFAVPAVNLIAGTAWLFARQEIEQAPVDYLFVDEAGQVALADAIAMGTCAQNLVFLGDPLQLAQVTQGSHPPGSGVSVLEHLLGDAATIPPDRGIFLERTFRMHPDITAFISEIVYEGRLRSAEGCERQTTSFGTGMRFIPVEHDSNRRRSSEEAAAIAAEIAQMRDGEYVGTDGTSRLLDEADFMVVAPYNEQVRCLRDVLPDAVRVGTVDKFQGQEAPVVFFSMATSSGEDVPRNMEFLFSRNRLNVAVSRARCLAILVASPRVLEARCRTINQMRLVNALCRLVEFA